MTKKSLFFLIACLIGNYAQGQSYALLARTSDGRWRYYNLKGEVIYDKQHRLYFHFSEDGVAVAGEEHGYTLINRKGDEIPTEIPVKIFDDHHFINAWFASGLLVTRHYSEFGCLDTLGRIAVPYKYYDLTSFANGYGIGRIKRKYFVVNNKGEEIWINDSTITKARAFHEGLAIYSNKAGKEGFIDTNGKVVIPAQFNGVGIFSNGLAWARRNDGLIGYIDPEGKWIIQPTLNAAKPFDKESGLARVKCKTGFTVVNDETGEQKKYEGGNWVYMDATGAIIVFDVMDDTRDFSSGLAICKKNGQYGFINNKGQWVISPKFDEVVDFESEFTVAKQNDLWGIINREGDWVLQPTFEVVKGGLVKLK